MRIRAYHGTNAKFDSFDSDYRGIASKGDGTDTLWFFAEDKEHAIYWAEQAVANNGGTAYLLEVELEGEVEEIDLKAEMEKKWNITLQELADRSNADIIKFTNARDDESGELRTMYGFISDKVKIISRVEL